MPHITAGQVTIVSNERFKQPAPEHPSLSDQRGAEETQGWSGYRTIPGNQATYLFFPNFASMVLIIVSSVSTPMIKGLSLADIHLVSAGGKFDAGTVKLGAWGWCLSGISGTADQCSARRAVGGSFAYLFESLPESLKPLEGLKDVLPREYSAASDAMNIISCIIAYWTIGSTLAASGAWSSQWQKAYKWTRIAYWSTFISLVFTAIGFFLDIKKYTTIAGATSGPDESKPHFTPGPVIWLRMVALIIGLGSCLVRVLLLQYRPRPSWTMKGSNDFTPPAPPSNSALPASDELPPTWESLNTQEDEKAPLEKADIEEVALDDHPPSPKSLSPDFSAPRYKFPSFRGGSI